MVNSDHYNTQYQAATESAALIDRSNLGRLHVYGNDAIDLLDRLSTNKLHDLKTGQVMGSVLTSSKGRIVDLIFIAKHDGHLSIITGPDTKRKVSEWIDFYTFSEDVSVQDVSSQTMMFSLVGPDSSVLLTEIPGMETYTNLSTTIEGTPTIIYRMNHTKYYLIVESQLGNKLAEILTSRGATKITDEVQELIRIETATAGYNTELNEKFNPLETGLSRFISFNKGCYIGQEVVARLNTYKKVQKKLVALSWCVNKELHTNQKLFADGKDVGNITSISTIPVNGSNIGLGIVRNAYTKPGTSLTVEDGTSITIKQIKEDLEAEN